MKCELATLYWDNSEYLIQSHKKVIDYLELPVGYYHLDGVRPGIWMDHIMNNTKSDVVGFIDSDCVPLNIDIVRYAADYAERYESMFSIAQCSNHIAPYNHVFAAPSFMFIHRGFWEKIGKPTFCETPRSDVGEEVSRVASDNHIPYKVLYPTHFEREPIEGVWRLSNFGYFGIGTVFGESVYHLYQGRYKQNADLFAERCNNIVDGTFSTDNFFVSTAEHQGLIMVN